jgi:hypothetical protein
MSTIEQRVQCGEAIPLNVPPTAGIHATQVKGAPEVQINTTRKAEEAKGGGGALTGRSVSTRKNRLKIDC